LSNLRYATPKVCPQSGPGSIILFQGSVEDHARKDLEKGRIRAEKPEKAAFGQKAALGPMASKEKARRIAPPGFSELMRTD